MNAPKSKLLTSPRQRWDDLQNQRESLPSRTSNCFVSATSVRDFNLAWGQKELGANYHPEKTP